jgi:putative inorganic carbon (HCO3(-)) transporter
MFGSLNSILPEISADQPVRRFLRGLFTLGMIAGYPVLVLNCPEPAPLSWIGLLACLYLGLCVVDPDAALGILMVYLPLQFEVIQGVRLVVTDMLVVVLIGVVWLRTVLGGRIFRFGSGTGLLLLWMTVLLVSTATSLNPTVSINVWIRAARCVVVFLIVCDQIQTRSQLGRLLLWLIMSGLLLAVDGIGEFVLRITLIPWEGLRAFPNWMRIQSLFDQSNLLAWWLVPLVPWGIAAVLLAGDRRGRILWGLATAAIGCAILLTFSRGGWLALGVVFLAVPIGRKIKMAGLIGMIVLVLVSAPLSGIAARKDSIERRTYRYLSAPLLTAHHPGWGYGPGTYKSLDRYEPDLFPPELGGKYSHSLYITLAVETGLISTAIFIVLLVRIGREFYRALHPPVVVSPANRIRIMSMAAAFVGILTLECFHSSMQSILFWTWLAVFQVAPAVLDSDPSGRAFPV